MFPWSSRRSVSAVLDRGEQATVRSAKQEAQEFKKLQQLAAAETDFDGVTLSTEDRMSKAYIARTLAESAAPAGALNLRRIWRDIDAMIGPGQSVLHVLSTRYPKLAKASDRMARNLRQSLRAPSGSARNYALSQMKKEMSKFANLRTEIANAVKADSTALKAALSTQLADREFAELLQVTSGKTASAKLLGPSVDELVAETESALMTMEKSFKSMYEAAVGGKDARQASIAWQKAARDDVKALRDDTVNSAARNEEMASRIRSVAKWGDPVDLGGSLAEKLRRKLRNELPILEEIKDSDRMFQEALGIVAQAHEGNRKLLRAFVEQGPSSLKDWQLRKIEGYLNQMHGLLPEAAATQMKFMEGVFYKRAFEALADFPPALRRQMSVEMVEGPLWVVGTKGPPRQFGDGCLLLTGPNGHSAIIGLGEYKAGFDSELLEQLFERSDRRAVSSKIKFRGADGKTHFRTLTREFSFDGGRTQAMRDPPLYVYGRPGGETPETEALFKQMIDEEMKSGREMYKVQLPFSADANSKFANTSLGEAVKVLREKDPKWGK